MATVSFGRMFSNGFCTLPSGETWKISNDGVLIDRALLRKGLGTFAAEFEKIYKVYSRPGAAPATPAAND